MARPENFISRYRGSVTAWLQAQEDLNALRAQYDALDLGNALTEEDFVGANDDVSKEQFVAAVGSVEAIEGFAQTGHYTNLYQLKQ